MAAAIADRGSLPFRSEGVASGGRLLHRGNGDSLAREAGVGISSRQGIGGEAAEVDPRWVIAVAAMRALEGGRAAIIPAESRRQIVSLARALGLRAFDAGLVIAIVQDAARRGEPLGGAAASRLELVPRARVEANPSVWPLAIAAALVGAALCAAYIAIFA